MEISNPFNVLSALEEEEQKRREKEYMMNKIKEYNRFRIDFEHNGKLFTKAGIIPMMSENDAKEICRKLEELNHKNMANPDCKEAFCIFRQDITKHFRYWGENISQRILSALEKYNWRHLLPQDKKLMQRTIKPNRLLREFLEYMWSYIPMERFKPLKWQAILSIEAITSDAFSKSNGFWKENNYSFFCGKTDERQDKSIFKTAIREAREEGKIKFSREIFNTQYQRNIRQKYGLSNLPISIDICFNKNKNRHSKIIVLFIEDINSEIRVDSNGGYLYIYPKK